VSSSIRQVRASIVGLEISDFESLVASDSVTRPTGDSTLRAGAQQDHQPILEMLMVSIDISVVSFTNRILNGHPGSNIAGS
jgi:hypothetical protein